jgi:hypothetical protein
METGALPGGIWGLKLVMVVIVSWILYPLRLRGVDATDIDGSPKLRRTATMTTSNRRAI